MARGSLVTERVCKIRKRGCSSSSSSSSILKNHRLKRALLVGRRGASTTPVPTWKISYSPSSVAFGQSPRSHNVAHKAKKGTVSARKLAATLWEMNEVPHVQQQRKESVEKTTKSGKSSLSTRDRRSSVSGSSGPPHIMDSEVTDRSGPPSISRRISAVSQRYKFLGLDSPSNTCLMEIGVRSKAITPTGSLVALKSHTNRTGDCSSTYKELLKVLSRIWGLEEEHSTSMSLVSALHEELKRARLRINRLVEEHRSDRHEIEYIMKRLAEEKAAWRSREQERIQAAVRAIGDELETERKLRRRTLSMNKRLGRELAETKGLLAKAMKELECERKVRQVMEKLSHELVRGISEDKAEVEELKRESAKVWEEVKRERQMLQLADVWREERVQMKLADAKFQLEEKNAALDKLRNELEAFLKMKKMNTKDKEEIPGAVVREEQQESDHGSQTRKDIDQDYDEEDSADSDLHSIELNRDEISRSYNWNYASGATVKGDDLERLNSPSLSIDAGKDARFIDWEVGSDENDENGITGQRCYENRGAALYASCLLKQDYDLEMQRYKYVKGLRDQVMAGSIIMPASPTQRLSQLQPSLEQENVFSERSDAAGMANGMTRSGAKTWTVETIPEVLLS